MSTNITQYRCMLNEKKHPVLRETATYEVVSNIIDSPEGMRSLLNDCLDFESLAEEYVVAIATTKKGEVLGIFEVSHGTMDASLISPRELFLRLLLCGAGGFVMAHNHPSGIPTPSKEDHDIFQRIKSASELMGIPFLDNMIVGKDAFYSFKMEGLL